MSDLSSYFDSYARVVPSWQEFLDKCKVSGINAVPGISDKELDKSRNSDGSPGFIAVTESNYPKLYVAAYEEAQFRGVPVPALYIDIRESEQPPAQMIPGFYTIVVRPEIYEKFSKGELRGLVAHELKHLYQGQEQTDEDRREAELDADRAAVESVGFKTIQRAYRKMAAVFLSGNHDNLTLRKLSYVFHRALPCIGGKEYWDNETPKYPSMRSRVEAMRMWQAEHSSVP